jgi:hypothetical protein
MDLAVIDLFLGRSSVAQIFRDARDGVAWRYRLNAGQPRRADRSRNMHSMKSFLIRMDISMYAAEQLSATERWHCAVAGQSKTLHFFG